MRRFSTLFTAVVAALALSCDGDTQVAGGGVGGSGISQGTVSAFGSIFVTGIEWNVDGATITLDGQPAANGQDDLFLGQVVTVTGSIDAARGTGRATTVVFDTDVEGPIDAVAPVGNDGVRIELDVLDDVVVVDSTVTSFAPAFGAGFASLAPGDVVRVSGFRDDAGRIHATFVEQTGTLVFGVTAAKLAGTVSGFTGGPSFQLGSVAVAFDPTGTTTDLSDLPGGVANGREVEVRGVVTGPNQVTATRIEDRDDLDDADDARVEGLITSFTSLADFTVGRVRVDASAAALAPNDPTVFGAGVAVEVEGTLVGGVLRASELELHGEDVGIDAAVVSDTDVDAASGTLRLLGVTITTDSSTRFEDGRDDVPGFSLTDIRGGDFLEVRGYLDASGGFRATVIERDDVDDVFLQAPLEAFDAGMGTVTLLGVVVPTDGRTEFEGEDDGDLLPSEFFALVAVGDLVSVEDEEDGDATAIDVADEVEIETAAGASPSLPAPSAPAVAPLTVAPDAASPVGADDTVATMRLVRAYFTRMFEIAADGDDD